MKSSKFYQPELAKLRSHELLFAQEKLNNFMTLDEDNNPVFDFVAEEGGHIMTRRIGMVSEENSFHMGPYQITYNFSSAGRFDSYGTKGFPYRILYEFLCGLYNAGYPFIDTYFAQVFKTRPVYQDFDAIYERIETRITDEILTRGIRDAQGRFMNFEVWKDPIIIGEAYRMATAIRKDIVVCLSTGMIPLNKKVLAPSTIAKRKRLGITSDKIFFATGKLIEHCNIYVAVGEREAA